MFHRVVALILLAGNNLEAFAPSTPLAHLEDLKLTKNALTTLDLSPFPALRRLDIDHNSISTFRGISRSKDLSHVSYRSQRTEKSTPYHSLRDIQHLYLSSNSTPIFSPTTPFLNLHTLELASCGLHTLCSDFGEKCPNIRSLSLNYNALRDLDPLSGIMRLERLYLAGNRIAKLRHTASILEHLSPCLRELDLRHNPLTLGFYSPAQDLSDEKRLIIQHQSSSSSGQADTDAHWAMQHFLPRLNGNEDSRDRQRLDEATKIRRRVYEMLVSHTCSRLKWLDGLAINHGAVARKDGVWRRLRGLGVLKEVAGERTGKV